MSDVLDALDIAAGAEESRDRGKGPNGLMESAISTGYQRFHLRRRLVRFLENLPEDMTVNEIRQELEGGDDA